MKEVARGTAAVACLLSLALPGSDDSIRGLTVDAWIVAEREAIWTNEASRPNLPIN
jgi:hypothetical protein